MGRRDHMLASSGKAKKGTLKRLIKLCFTELKWYLLILLICIAFQAISSNLSSIFIRNITDSVIVKGIQAYGINEDPFATVLPELTKILLTMVGIYLVGIISSYLLNRIGGVAVDKFLNSVRKKIFSHMETLPIRYFDQRKRGDIMSIYTNDVDTLRQLVGNSFPNLISTFISACLLLGIMFTSSIYLSAIIIVGSIIMLISTKGITKNTSKYFIKQQKITGKVEGFIEEAIKGQKVIKVFNHESNTKEEFDELNKQLTEDSCKARIYSNVLAPIMGNVGNLIYVCIAVVGTILCINGVPNLTILGVSEEAITVGIVVSFLTMSRQFTNTIRNFGEQIGFIVMGLAGASRCFEILDEQSEQDEGYVTLVHAVKLDDGTITETSENTKLYAWKHPHEDGTISYTELKGDIRLFDVDFGYYENELVLHNIDIYAKPGQKIAFVGATGAGKTTITNLINRFYDIADGKIRYDGININKIKKPDLRRSLGIVLQDTNLFTGTVKDNIRYGRLDASDEDIIAASKIANAYDFITRLPQGFDTPLSGDGANLSQGQRQLISIARAAIKDAPVMILDEATSSIDTRTELLVQKGTDKLMENRTVFVIAHRLSTVQNSNAIMVLDHGKIIERGTHEDLIALKGTYYQLYTGAFELE